MKNPFGLELHGSLAELCRPDRMAVVVYDMQAGILSQIADGAAIIARNAAVLAAARAGGYRVIFLRHMSMPPRLMGRFQYRQAMAWQRTEDPGAVKPWFLRSSPGFEITPELAPREDEAILDKITFSAFADTPLATILRDCGLTAFAIMGVAIEIGIEPTARHGADLGFVPVIVQDACGTGNKEAAERSFTSLAYMGDAILTQSGTLTGMMARATE
ncbi:cysteine hydrolase [Labrys sp. ZIDIC5]|uniref:cysteine hydrolase n=1 Tax=Labrys sedimenti TaxID=3106036 RepID=UPI002ACA5B8F|nr:cysteine hydrolase [Labrys sp. ZIDIC5]MDZ5454263.1 cysteine hydrolase [Labrys sp. ZIDIC5]